MKHVEAIDSFATGIQEYNVLLAVLSFTNYDADYSSATKTVITFADNIKLRTMTLNFIQSNEYQTRLRIMSF